MSRNDLLSELSAAIAKRSPPIATLSIDPVVAVAHPDNRASHAVLRKIGLRPSGRAIHYGQDLDFYRLTRAEYLKGR